MVTGIDELLDGLMERGSDGRRRLFDRLVLRMMLVGSVIWKSKMGCRGLLGRVLGAEMFRRARSSFWSEE